MSDKGDQGGDSRVFNVETVKTGNVTTVFVKDQSNSEGGIALLWAFVLAILAGLAVLPYWLVTEWAATRFVSPLISFPLALLAAFIAVAFLVFSSAIAFGKNRNGVGFVLAILALGASLLVVPIGAGLVKGYRRPLNLLSERSDGFVGRQLDERIAEHYGLSSWRADEVDRELRRQYWFDLRDQRVAGIQNRREEAARPETIAHNEAVRAYVSFAGNVCSRNVRALKRSVPAELHDGLVSFLEELDDGTDTPINNTNLSVCGLFPKDQEDYDARLVGFGEDNPVVHLRVSESSLYSRDTVDLYFTPELHDWEVVGVRIREELFSNYHGDKTLFFEWMPFLDWELDQSSDNDQSPAQTDDAAVAASTMTYGDQSIEIAEVHAVVSHVPYSGLGRNLYDIVLYLIPQGLTVRFSESSPGAVFAGSGEVLAIYLTNNTPELEATGYYNPPEVHTRGDRIEIERFYPNGLRGCVLFNVFDGVPSLAGDQPTMLPNYIGDLLITRPLGEYHLSLHGRTTGNWVPIAGDYRGPVILHHSEADSVGYELRPTAFAESGQS